MEFSLLYLIAYPDVQAKVHEELARVVGNRKPSLEDRDRLPYTQAFLQEATRFMPMGLLPPPRRASEDVTLKNGMVIPKNTQVTVMTFREANCIFTKEWHAFQVFNCFNTIHMDAGNFADPETFKPERFLDGNGDFVRSDKVILFGIGKRRCPGEILARAEYFLFLTHLIQTFQMKATGPVDFSTVPGLGFTPVPYDVVFVPRH